MRTFKSFLTETIATKAGILPYFVRDDGTLEFMYMTSSDANFGGSDPMIAKGHVDAGEDVKTAAVREGSEELGLRESNIVNGTLIEGWTGKLTGLTASYTMTIFTCEVKNQDDFDTPHYETAHIDWFTYDESLSKVRKSQIDIVKHIYQRIKKSE